MERDFEIFESPEWSDNKISRHYQCKRCSMRLVTPLSTPLEGNIEVVLRAHLADAHPAVLEKELAL